MVAKVRINKISDYIYDVSYDQTSFYLITSMNIAAKYDEADKYYAILYNSSIMYKSFSKHGSLTKIKIGENVNYFAPIGNSAIIIDYVRKDEINRILG